MVWVCPACKLKLSSKRLRFPVHCSCGFVQYSNPPGLGDRAAAALAHLGITEKRYKATKKALGFREDCRCKKRQQALNRIGRHDDVA